MATYGLVSIRGVQHAVAAARTTRDLATASQMMSELARIAHNSLEQGGWEVVFPSPPQSGSTIGMPNRLWAVSKSSVASLPDIGKALSDEVAEWASGHGQVPHDFPAVTWAMYETDDYADAWSTVTGAMVGRKRVHDFASYPSEGRRGRVVCSTCGERESLDSPRSPLRDGERLCGLCSLKRSRKVAGHRPFPSTAHVATMPFRRDVWAAIGAQEVASAVAVFVEVVKELAHVWSRSGGDPKAWPFDVTARQEESSDPYDYQTAGAFAATTEKLADRDGLRDRFMDLGGVWFYPETYDRLAASVPMDDVSLRPLNDAVAVARKALADLLAKADLDGPTPYLAILVQDVDNMGDALRAKHDPTGAGQQAPSRAYHTGLTKRLAELGADVAGTVDGAWGRSVYSGGDDYLGFVGVADAIPLAEQIRTALNDATHLPKATASTAVVFFHMHYPLRSAVRRAHLALKEAKAVDAAKGRLAVVELRRGGERASTRLTWKDGAASHSLLTLTRAFNGPLSARILPDLEALNLAEVPLPVPALRPLVERYAERHGGDENVRKAMVGMWGMCPSDSEERPRDWIDAIRIAHFVAQEGGAE